MSVFGRRRFLGALAALTTLTAPTALPVSAQPAARQFVYVLRVAAKYHDPAAWTDKDNAIVAAHFKRLQQATEAGQVVLAGRSDEALDKTFGLVVFEAENEAAARAFMLADPAVEAGLMTATLHPYAVALQRKR